MGWMQKLCEAYDAGIECDQSKERKRLVLLGFICKKVKYHVVLTLDGQFVSADELTGENQKLEIPSTPEAESRTGKNGAPFPLIEQMKYLIFEDENFDKYMEQLNAWCEQPDAPACLRAVYTYLNGHTLLKDLQLQLYLNDAKKHDGIGEDTKAMVCFSVQMQDGESDDLWRREDVRKSWSNFLAVKLSSDRKFCKFCYVEGEELPLIEKHPKLRGNAKLISAEDQEFPFQYKGRFVDDRSAASVSFYASVRAHNALSWLINRQGMQRYGMIWVVWNTNGATMKVPIDENNGFIEEEEDEEAAASKPVIDTFASYAEAVNTAASSYGNNLHKYNPKRTNCAVILGLEAATDGRMSITYYQECLGNEYVARLEDWYQACCWWRYQKIKKTKEIATPNLHDIAIAVMGIDAVNIASGDKKCEKSQTKLMRKLQSRILTCIVDKQPLPLDIVRNAFNRVCAPLSFVGGKDRQWSRSAWENSVDTACAMIYCFQKRRNEGDCEKFAPELQMNSNKRDYLYGRLLAVADFIEEKAMGKGRDYPTNVVRLMQQFVQHPFETWPKIYERMIHNFKMLGLNAKVYQMIFGEIEYLFLGEDRYERGALSLEFLQGFSSQRQMLFHKLEFVMQKREEKVRYELPKRRSELYGCLLAIADVAEQDASHDERTGKTNAMQMISMFTARPYESWGRLHDKLLPYLEKLGEKADYYQRLIAFVEMQFSQLDRESTIPLNGSYLHGYYCMRQTFYQKSQFSGEPSSWKDAKDMRSALYGQLLGIAERLERKRFVGETEGRFTNELRFMTAFAQKPEATWENLKVKLKPYQRYVGNRAEKDNAMLEQLEAELQQNGWNTNTPLSSIYLHYYYKERKQ